MFHVLRVFLRRLLRRDRFERELGDELQFHLEARIEDLVRRGLSPEEARRRARIEFGGVEQYKERLRAARPGALLDSLRQDLLLALRLMRRSPVVSTVGVLSLALGIGANTAIFSVVNGAVLRPLPVREPERLVLVSSTSTGGIFHWSNPIWEQVRRHGHLFDGACAWARSTFTTRERGEASTVQGLWVDGRFFETLGVSAVRGRALRDEDDRRGGGPDGPVVVISHGFWQRRYGGSADVIGRALSLDDVPFTIVGVAPPGFFGLDVGRTFDVALPIASVLATYPQTPMLDGFSNWLSIMLRLKPHQTLEQATEALRRVQPQIRKATLPETGDASWYLKDPFLLEEAATGQSQLRGVMRPLLATFMTVVAVVWLIACANIANLFLARATARNHELCVRRALGASRLRLARQCLVESLLLSGIGTVLGAAVAPWAGHELVRRIATTRISTTSSQIVLDLSPDWRVFLFGAAACLATAILFGIAPAVRSARVTANEVMSRHTPGLTNRVRIRIPALLVVGQVALTLVLVVAAGLLVRTFSTLVRTDPGFDRDRVLVVDVTRLRSPVRRPARLVWIDTICRAASTVPGVTRVGASFKTPVTDSWMAFAVQVQGGTELPPDRREAMSHLVSPGWFATVGAAIVAGRDFTDADRPGAPLVAIVNQAFVTRHRLGTSPIGRVIRVGHPTPGPPIEIVGVVKDIAQRSLRENVPPALYVPLQQSELRVLPTFFVRADRIPPLTLARSLSTAIRRVDPDVMLEFQPLSAYVDDSVTSERALAQVSTMFSVLALFLAVVGLYGITTYAVSRRRREIGIRVALGAAPAEIVRSVLTRVAWLAGLGVAIGTGIGLWAARFVESLLFGVKARDPLTFAVGAAILVATALLAGWLPALRATRVDPAMVLRSE